MTTETERVAGLCERLEGYHLINHPQLGLIPNQILSTSHHEAAAELRRLAKRVDELEKMLK